MQQILAILVIILKYKMRPIKRVPTITAKVMLVTTAKITTIERILVVLKHKESSNKCYRLY